MHTEILFLVGAICTPSRISILLSQFERKHGGPAAGAIYTNAAAPGPIYLQGDHTAVSYRDIYLAPVMSKD